MRFWLMSLSGCLLVLGSLPASVWALGMEDIGNKPLNAANFQEWPGIMPVVNDEHRVYHFWVNGSEACFYQGDTAAVNAALKHFAATKEKVHEVVLLPGPAEISSFQKDKTFKYNWKLQMVGGIAKHMASKDQGAQIWNEHPMLTIYVGNEIQLDRLQIPEGVVVLEQADLEKRYARALASTDRTVRGWSTGHLAAMNRYSESNMNAIAKLLQDEQDWVRLNAAGALAAYGRQAKPLLPALRAALQTEDERLKTRVKQTIERIEQAPDESAAAKAQQGKLAKIHAYCEGLKK